MDERTRGRVERRARAVDPADLMDAMQGRGLLALLLGVTGLRFAGVLVALSMIRPACRYVWQQWAVGRLLAERRRRADLERRDPDRVGAAPDLRTVIP